MRCVSPIRLKNPSGKAGFLDVPCGYCGSCRHNRRVDWSYRLNVEFKNSSHALFITLTYSNENLKYHESGCPTLCKDDLQKFLKRIRRKQSGSKRSGIRYYAVGEYGSNTYRPHYHMLLFNCVLDKSDIVGLWSSRGSQLGNVHFGDVGEASIHYMTKYHVNYDKKFFEGVRDPEFAIMSRNPGIGYQYVKDSGSWNSNNGYLHLVNNGYMQRMPRYYREKLFSKEMLEILGEIQVAESESREGKEIERLRSLGYDDPYSELQSRLVAQANAVKHKASKDDVL
jgi:hypothetical protein